MPNAQSAFYLIGFASNAQSAFYLIGFESLLITIHRRSKSSMTCNPAADAFGNF